MSSLGGCLEGLKNLHISQNTQNTNNTQNKRSSKSNHDSNDKEVLKGLIEHKTKQVSEKVFYSLETLPSDLLKHKIISYLAFQDLFSVLMLSKKIHRCINFEDLLSTVAREGSQKLTENPKVNVELIKEEISKWVRFLELNNYQIPKWRNRFFKAKQGIKKVVKFNKKAKVVNVTSPYVQEFFKKKLKLQEITDVFLDNINPESYIPILRLLEGYSERPLRENPRKIRKEDINLIFENVFNRLKVINIEYRTGHPVYAAKDVTRNFFRLQRQLRGQLLKDLRSWKRVPFLPPVYLKAENFGDKELNHLSRLSSLTSLII